MKTFNSYINSEKEYLTEGTALANVKRLSEIGPINAKLRLAGYCHSKSGNMKIEYYYFDDDITITDENGRTDSSSYQFYTDSKFFVKAPQKINVHFKITKTFTDKKSIDYGMKFFRQAIQLKEEIEKIDPKFLPLYIYDKDTLNSDRNGYKLVKIVEGGLVDYNENI